MSLINHFNVILAQIFYIERFIFEDTFCIFGSTECNKSNIIITKEGLINSGYKISYIVRVEAF